MSSENLDRLFNPKTIAVIGATNNKTSVGHYIFRNIIGSEFEGTVYPVNPNRTSVQGVNSYPSISKIPEKIDLAIIATPSTTVLSLVEECGQKGVGGLVIVSAGFTEAGEKGKKLSTEVLATARKYGMRILGPNCLGFIKPQNHLNASFANTMALPGKIAFISQSGALGTAILDLAREQNVGFRHFVSLGAMLDIGFHDLIDYFGKDPETKSILIYMESLTEARKFMSAARAFSRTKPIIVLKSGKSSEGSRAAASHTGSLAGDDTIFDAAFKRAGIIRVETIQELFDCAKALAMQKRPARNRLAIVTNAGGPGVIGVDYLTKKGGTLATLSPKTLKALDKFLPAAWSNANPVDILGDADPPRYKQAIDICIEDENVDGILILLTPQAMTNPTEIARDISAIKNPEGKTILASFMGENDVREGIRVLEKAHIPTYHTPENAIDCFINMYNYSKNIQLLYQTPGSIPHQFVPKLSENKKLIARVVSQGRYVLTEAEAKEFVENYGIPVLKHAIAKTAEEAAKSAEKSGFPVAMKILSSDILHKTEVGGVKLNIKNAEEAMKAFSEIMQSVKKKSPKATIDGVFIEHMETKKYELIIGCKKDAIFGPAIMFGMGGVAVEVFKDVNVGLPPLNMALSMMLIEETKIYNLLKGYRNIKGVDIKAIQFLLYKFSYLVMDFPEIQEIDINPFAVDENGGVVLDAKVILDKDLVGKKITPHSHLVISPYPKEYVKTAKMRDGKEILLRPIRPEDEPMEAEMFTKFSADTQRFRFFTRLNEITHEMLVKYTQIDYDREMAIIAETSEQGKKKMAGVVRLISDPLNDSAEFAIVVADPWQKQGLGNQLTDYILKIARDRNLKKVYAYFLQDNFVMKHMFESRGFLIKEQGDSSYAELALEIT